MASSAVGFSLAIAAFGVAAALLCACLDSVDDIMLTTKQPFAAALRTFLAAVIGQANLTCGKEPTRSKGYLVQDEYPPTIPG